MKKTILKRLLFLMLALCVAACTSEESQAPAPQETPEQPEQPEQPDEPNLPDDPVPPVEEEVIELLGGQALYQGADAEYKDLGFVQVELWDVVPNEETGRVDGRFFKLKLFITMPLHGFRAVPAGTYTLSEEAAPFVAVPGFDDGVNIPTGCYLSDRTGGGFDLWMLEEGTIEIAEEGTLALNLRTHGGEWLKAELNTPMELQDLTGGFAPSAGGLSTLEQDVEFAYGDDTTALLLDYGDFYENGTRSVTIQLLDDATQTGMVLDLILPSADRYAPLPEGEFSVDLGYCTPFGFVAGSEQMGQPIGTYYCNFTLPDYYIGELFAPAETGTVTLEALGESRYAIAVDLLDDAKTPHAIRGTFTGVIENYE